MNFSLETTDLSYLVDTEARNGSVNDISFGSTHSDQFCCIAPAGACKLWDSSEYKCVFNIKHPSSTQDEAALFSMTTQS